MTQQLRRDATRVIYDILALGRDGESKTHIIFKANLSFQLAEKYIHFLVNKGLLRQDSDDEGLTRYHLTERGQRLLQLLREVENELNSLFVKTPSSKLGVRAPDSQTSFSLEIGRAHALTRTSQSSPS